MAQFAAEDDSKKIKTFFLLV